MKAYLRIKIKSLSGEIRDIHHAEHHWKARKRHQAKANHKNYTRSEATFWGLRHHRWELSREIRSAYLAYGFLRGRRYDQLESKTLCAPNRSRIADLVVKYGEGKYPKPGLAFEAITAWVKEPPLQKQAA